MFFNLILLINGEKMKETCIKKTNIIIFACVIIALLSLCGVSQAYASGSSLKTGVVTATALNVRSGPGGGYISMGLLYINDEVEIVDTVKSDDNKDWYKIKYETSSGFGYVSADFILVNSESQYETDESFEDMLDSQGFPDSYKPYLRDLHSKYPKWVFKGAQTGLSWNDVIERESQTGKSLVAGSSIPSWKSMEKGAYDFSSGSYISYDSGNWVCASESIIKYYMDPRNFINSVGIFQFLSHSYDKETQDEEGLHTILSGTFMENSFPEDGYDTYAQVLADAGKKANVNPYVLASMIIVEQGSNGRGASISGTVSGYEGYYNYFNIGAYKSGSMDAVTRGLWYASQEGSYERPWNSRYKSIIGGASFYGKTYVQNNKNTLYFKKWNVMNGIGNVGSGQYMTNVQGAESEAAALRKGYVSVLDKPMTFYIPIYKGMPAKACIKPSSGNNNNYLYKLSVTGLELDTKFDRYNQAYSLSVDTSVESVFIDAKASSTAATVSGGGKIRLTSGTTSSQIKVTSSSGITRTYVVKITKVKGCQKPEGEEPTQAPKKGDVNGDGFVDEADRTAIENHILGIKKLENEYAEYADINEDKKVNSLDALLIQKYLEGKYDL